MCLSSCGASGVQNLFQPVTCRGNAEMSVSSFLQSQHALLERIVFEISQIHNAVFVIPMSR